MEASIYFTAGALSNDTDLGKSFNKLVSETFTHYSGCLIEKTKTGFMVSGKSYPTLEAAKDRIDNTFKNWKVS